MIHKVLVRYFMVALPLLGSAILLFSCEAKKTTTSHSTNLENLMTEYSENLSIVTSENGQKSYHFTTPLMEGYALAREPYKEFRKGVKVVTYDGDTTTVESATLTANYAIFYETRKLWEAKGDVVVIQREGRRLYTSQLFWNQATHRIYSNVDSRVVDGDEVYDCEGFESDEEMKDWHYRKIKGVTYFTEPEPKPESDSLDGEEAKSKSPAEEDVKKEVETPTSAPKVKATSVPKTKPATQAKSTGPIRTAKPVKPLPGDTETTIGVVKTQDNQLPVRGGDAATAVQSIEIDEAAGGDTRLKRK